MSNSFKHTPITGCGTSSEKRDKQLNNRRIHRETREKVARWIEDIYTEDKKLVEVYSWNKDGKYYFGDFKNKDKEYYKKLLRK